MKLNLMAALAAVAALCAGVAQAQSFVIEANGAHAGALNGGELGLGYSWANNRVRITPIVGAFIYKGDNDRYYNQTLSNGTTVCRDGNNGQFSDKENCDNTATKAYGKIEGAVRIRRVEVGAGVRLSSRTTPYGLATYALTDQFALKAFAGDDYYGAGLALRF